MQDPRRPLFHSTYPSTPLLTKLLHLEESPTATTRNSGSCLTETQKKYHNFPKCSFVINVLQFFDALLNVT